MNEKIKEVFSDEEFVKSLMEMETPEEVQNALVEKDIDLSTDEIKKMAEMLQKKSEGELNDEELENVAGGSIVCLTIAAIIAAAPIAATAVYEVRTFTRRRW